MSMIEQQAKAPAEIRAVISFLRSSKAGLKNRVGVLNGKRIDYFKGKSAVKALLSPAYAKVKGAPKVTSESEAQMLLHNIIPFAFFLRVDRGQPAGAASSPKLLQINQMQVFKPEDYYAWFYEGSQWTTYVGGIAMVAVILAGVMFPLWPPIFRLGVWYLSIAVLGLVALLIAIAIIRLIFYVITLVVASPGIWIFPKLFADVGFIESFIPLWEWDVPKKKSKKRKGEKSEKGEKSDKADKADTMVTADKPAESLEAASESNGTSAEHAPDSGSSHPQARAPTVEEVPDEDS